VTLRDWASDLLPHSPLARLRHGSWRRRSRPAACKGVPTMLMDDELRLLEYLTERYYRRRGAIVDAGSFLGGSTVALASGLRKNLARRGQREEKLIHSYDLFRIEDWTRGLYFPEDAAAGASTRDLFDRNTAGYAPLIEVHEGDITHSEWSGGPIEILFVDIAKQCTVCDWITWNLFPWLIPGRSVVVQQDYLWDRWTAWLHITMEYYDEYFETLCDTGRNSVAFRLVRRFEPGALRRDLVQSLPLDAKIALMDRAAERFSGDQAELLRSAKDHFLETMADA
jgi:hypothetical protein